MVISTRVNSSGGNGWSSWRTNGSLNGTVNIAPGNIRWSPTHGANRNSLVVGAFEFVANRTFRQWERAPQMSHQLRR